MSKQRSIIFTLATHLHAARSACNLPARLAEQLTASTAGDKPPSMVRVDAVAGLLNLIDHHLERAEKCATELEITDDPHAPATPA